jgi:hypothetical protein
MATGWRCASSAFSRDVTEPGASSTSRGPSSKPNHIPAEGAADKAGGAARSELISAGQEIMWIGGKYAAMVIAGAALAAGVAVSASAEHRNNGYAGVSTSDGAPVFDGGLEVGGGALATAPAPGRAHPGQRRREPRRLE